MKKLVSRLCCLLVAAMPLLLVACGPGNSVRLLPLQPLSASTIPPPNAPSISVVNFKDERLDTSAVGVRRDGSAFTTTGDVAVWISRALADELARNGFRVTFAMDANAARNSSPDYIVTGIVQEVWLKESSATAISVQMRSSCTLASRQKRLWTESCSTSQSRTSLPSGAAADNLLLDTLQDLVKPLAQKILQSTEGRK